MTVTEPLSDGSPVNKHEEIKEPPAAIPDTLSSTDTAPIVNVEKPNIIRNVETFDESEKPVDDASIADAMMDDKKSLDVKDARRYPLRNPPVKEPKPAAPRMKYTEEKPKEKKSKKEKKQEHKERMKEATK